MTNGNGHENENNGNGGGENSGHGGGGNGQGGDKGHGHNVSVIVDDRRFEVREGPWVVSELKAKTKVDPAKVLAEISPSGLVDLDDSATIEVKDGMKFMSHVRSGASS